MFNKKNFLFIPVSFIVLIFMMFITGCEFVENDLHKHLYSEEWSFSEKTHWHSALCCEGEKSEEKIHNFVRKVEKEWSCTESGLVVESCSVCGFSKEEEKVAEGHIYSAWKEFPGTCISEGYRIKVCENCGETVEEITGEAIGIHSFEDWKVTETPSCTAEGTHVRKCSVCDLEESERIPATGHDYSEWETIHATCVSEGKRNKTCNVCGDYVSETTYPATGIHMFGEWEVTENPSCTAEGTHVRKCSVCELEESERIPATGHDYSEWETVHATCVSEGKRNKTCNVCGDYVSETTYPATGIHMFGEWEVTETPSCTAEGIHLRKCSVCELEESERIPATGHDYSEWETIHATCVSEGKRNKTCNVCGDYVSETTYPATGIHMFGEWEVTETPSCTAEGTHVRKCSVCDLEESERIPATGHDYSEWNVTPATCVASEKRNKTCSRCGDEVVEESADSTGIHTYGEWSMIKETTCSEEGVKTRLCIVCGHFENETVVLLEHAWDQGNVIKVATVLEEGIKEFACETCGLNKIENLPLVPRENLEEIGMLTKLQNYKSEIRNNDSDFYSFGVWPQTIKADEIEVFPDIENTEGFTEKYYLGSDGCWYAQLEENPVNYGGVSSVNSRYAYSNGDYAQLKENGRVLYFKVEPIIWRKLGDSGILLSEKVLAGGISFYDNQKSDRKSGDSSLYSNNYEASSIRAYLNGFSYTGEQSVENTDYCNKGFLNGAFTKNMQDLILFSEIKNDSETTVDFLGLQPAADGTAIYENKDGTESFYPDYTCGSFFDKLFLLSLNELTNPDWGFNPGCESEDSNRRRKATDFAIADSVFLGDKGVNWYTRTPYYKVKDKLSTKNIVVNSSGKVSSTVYSDNAETGIVPALRFY